MDGAMSQSETVDSPPGRPADETVIAVKDLENFLSFVHNIQSLPKVV
jgi:hypothetical protein